MCVYVCICVCSCTRVCMFKHAQGLVSTSSQHSVLQCVAVCCIVLQCVVIRCSMLQCNWCDAHIWCMRCTAHHYALRHIATYCNMLQHTTAHCNTLQHTATAHCNVLQHVLLLWVVVCCSTLQSAPHRNIMRCCSVLCAVAVCCAML